MVEQTKRFDGLRALSPFELGPEPRVVNMETHSQNLAVILGTRFESRYEILEKIGEGGFGSILKARQLTTGQEVALKIMRFPERGSSGHMDTRTARFLREAQLCAKLRHPNIVPIIDSGQTESGGLYTVFAFVPGENLASLLAREGALAPQEARHLMLQVLDALACAHAQGVIHRDLKPSNIMVVSTGARRNALVLDFGIGVIVEATNGESWARLTATNDALGTPGYSAPEQWRSREPSPRADLFSWGLVFLECLTGTRVYRGTSMAEIFYELLGPDRVPLPAALERHPLGALIARAVRKDVAARDVTARGLFEDLDDCDLRRLSRGVMCTGNAFMPSDIVKGSTTFDITHPLSAGERRQVTAISCVLGDRGRPSGSARADDAEDEQLRAGLAFAADIARHHGGHVAAMLGDELLVYFGYPRAGEDDPRRAARVALRMLGALEARERRVRARIGVHVGFVVAHDDGDPALAAGCTSRLASWLARSASPGSVLVTVEAHKLLRSWFALEAERVPPADEGEATLEVFRLGSTDPTIGSTPETMQGPLVGREEEIDLLMARWHRARAGSGQSSLVTGEPGIGKSRLLRELRSRLRSEVYTFIEGRCAPDTQNNVLFPVVDLLARALGLDTEPSLTGKVARLEAELSRYGLTPSEAMPLFLPLFSLPSDGTWAPLDASPQKHKELTLSGVLALVFALAEQRPVLLVLEDLHWADPTTLELLGQLVREAPSAPLYVVLTARPEFFPSFSTDLLQVHLNRLDRAEIEAMVGVLVGRKALPPAVLEQIANRTDGVPLFVEELTRMMVDSGALVEWEDRYELSGSLSEVEIPSTLRGLLTARLDRLGPAKETAQLAATLGREFSVEVLVAVSVLGEARVQDDLDRLTDAGLVLRKRRAKDSGAVFKHALVRDAAYESLVLGARQKVHARVATTLEERFQGLVAVRPELLAHHWTAAGLIERAIPYWLQAGQRALGQSANQEAIRYLEQALDLLAMLPDTPARAAHELGLRLSLSVALIATQGYAAQPVGAMYERARQLCDVLGDSKQVFPCIWGLGAFYAVRAELDTALQLSVRVRAIAETEREPGLLVLAHLEHGGIHLWQGNLQAAKENLERGFSFYQPAEHCELAAAYSYDPGTATEAYLAMTLWFLGYPDRALAGVRAAVARTKAMGHAHSYVHSLTRAAQVTLLRGEGGPALADISSILAISEDKGFPLWHAVGTVLRGRALCLEGQADHGIAHIRTGLHRTMDTGAEQFFPEFSLALAEALAALERHEEALEAVTEALHHITRTKGHLYEAELCRLRGDLYLRADSTAAGAVRAEESLRRALDIAERQHARSWQLRAACSMARLWSGQRKTTVAYELLNDAYAWFTEGRDTPALRLAQEVLGELAQ